MGADVSAIKKHLQQISKIFHSSYASSVSACKNNIPLLRF